MSTIRGGRGYGTFAVYWRAADVREWRLHSTHTTPAMAERERQRLYWQYVAGWLVDRTLVVQYPPGLHAAPCLVIEELTAAPALEAAWPLRPYSKERQLRRPEPAEERLRLGA